MANGSFVSIKINILHKKKNSNAKYRNNSIMSSLAYNIKIIN